MFEVIPKTIAFKVQRQTGIGRKLPMNYTISVSYKCPSRCKTCNVWKKQADDLTLEEWGKVFDSIGKSPYWFTFSGGEPFLRPDIVELITLAYEKCAPAIINIPTNGMLWPTIIKKAPQIAKNCPKSEVVVNLSLDQCGELHEKIRGVPRNWEFSMKAWQGLKDAKRKMGLKNLTLGIHSVISNFNVKDFPEFHKELLKLEPDSYITEIAEERVELDTIGKGITPNFDNYSRAIDSLLEDMQKMFNEKKYRGVAKVAASFRMQYYQNVKKWLREKRQIIPCYAGWASAQIAPDGKVWECCIKATVLGDLRETNYNFKKIWFSDKAKKVRARIKAKKCHCPLANASYTNMLHHTPTLVRAGIKYLIK